MSYKAKSFQAAFIQTDTGLGKDTLRARGFGEFLAVENRDVRLKELTTSQLRRFFGQIKRLQAKGYSPKDCTDLLMLRPQLAYAVGRDRKKTRDGIKDASKIGAFYEEIAAAIRAVEHSNVETERGYFKNFVNLIEAVVAFHRFYGGE